MLRHVIPLLGLLQRFALVQFRPRLQASQTGKLAPSTKGWPPSLKWVDDDRLMTFPPLTRINNNNNNMISAPNQETDHRGLQLCKTSLSLE